MDLVRAHRPVVVVLLETRVSGMQSEMVKNRMGFSDVFRVEARGFADGIWSFWQHDMLQVEIFSSITQCIMQLLDDVAR